MWISLIIQFQKVNYLSLSFFFIVITLLFNYLVYSTFKLLLCNVSLEIVFRVYLILIIFKLCQEDWLKKLIGSFRYIDFVIRIWKCSYILAFWLVMWRYWVSSRWWLIEVLGNLLFIDCFTFTFVEIVSIIFEIEIEESFLTKPVKQSSRQQASLFKAVWCHV